MIVNLVENIVVNVLMNSYVKSVAMEECLLMANVNVKIIKSIFHCLCHLANQNIK